jgi:DNA polymerase III sliding clamp (beta) subunit (PCNA family)
LSSDGAELKITAVENQEIAGEDWVSDAVCAESGFPDVGVNANYLLDALSGFDDQELRLSQSVQANYLLLESASDPSKRDIVMPFRC